MRRLALAIINAATATAEVRAIVEGAASRATTAATEQPEPDTAADADATSRTAACGRPPGKPSR